MLVSETLTDEHPHARCVRDAVASTFSSICGEPPLYTGKDAMPPGETVIIGIISLVGAPTRTLMLSLPRGAAEGLSLAFVGMEIPFESDDMGDVVGEVANILAGSVIARMDGIGHSVEMSLPTVVRGQGVTHLLQDGLVCLPLHYQSPQGPFSVCIVAGDPARGAAPAVGGA